MAKKTDVFSVSSIDTVIGSGVKMRGNLSSEGDIAVDGTLAGNIKSGGQVTIGVNGRIVGNIDSTSVTIGGKVEGNVKALDTVSILESGHLHGDIDASQIEIGLGAVFIGTSKMKPAEATEIESLSSS